MPVREAAKRWKHHKPEFLLGEASHLPKIPEFINNPWAFLRDVLTNKQQLHGNSNFMPLLSHSAEMGGGDEYCPCRQGLPCTPSVIPLGSFPWSVPAHSILPGLFLIQLGDVLGRWTTHSRPDGIRTRQRRRPKRRDFVSSLALDA